MPGQVAEYGELTIIELNGNTVLKHDTSLDLDDEAREIKHNIFLLQRKINFFH